MTSNELAAYAAGLFDGEGHVGINRYRSRVQGEQRSHQLACYVTNTYKPALNYLQSHWGGYVARKSLHNKMTRECYVWRLTTTQAEPFLRDVQPYSIIKAEQIRLALEFRATQDGKRNKITDELFNYRELLRNRISVANQGIKMRLPVD